ncbi:RrF2 family transcriptional regulator [Paenibacillus sp. 1001270B_150601_E10]|uniref:RrF2 family transcriptional regulator n=1 Tax=Paenibacillus sp. 1001270B_150601_E10 TaxID=2787079 RepID=UPI00189FFD04|nr:Rrf2 family transcriptional regulator [Paenibacillus sp. 1001270B_150601_E10]
MQFQITTDYAVRIMRYLYHHQHQLSTAKNLSQELGITYQYFMKVIKRLREADFVESVQGCDGGYRMHPEAKDVTLYQIVEVMEGPIRINRCLEEDCFCSLNATATCDVRKIFTSLQKELIMKLEGIRIADIGR